MQNNQETINVIGHFAQNKNLYDGQTIKTRVFYDGLKKYSGYRLVTTDTYGWKKRPVKLFFNLVKNYHKSDKTIMMVDAGGIKIIPFVLCLLKKIWHKKLYYNVIGGWLPDVTKENGRIRNELKQFDKILVETSIMKEMLEEQNFVNVKIVTNFKDLQISDFDKTQLEGKLPKRFCIFSRITKKKGITDACNVIDKINAETGKCVVVLDIYGDIDEQYKEEFSNLIKSDNVNYCGKIEPSDSVSVIEKYNALLFPTLYFTEGIPGTIIDAFFSKTPIIAAKWRSYSDILNENNALLFELGSVEEFKKQVEIFINDDDLQTKLVMQDEDILRYDLEQGIKEFLKEME